MHGNINEFHMAFYSVALLVSFTILMQSFIQKRTDRVHNIVFITLVSIIMFNSLTEIVGEFARPHILESNAALIVDDI